MQVVSRPKLYSTSWPLVFPGPISFRLLLFHFLLYLNLSHTARAPSPKPPKSFLELFESYVDESKPHNCVSPRGPRQRAHSAQRRRGREPAGGCARETGLPKERWRSARGFLRPLLPRSRPARSCTRRSTPCSPPAQCRCMGRSPRAVAMCAETVRPPTGWAAVQPPPVDSRRSGSAIAPLEREQRVSPALLSPPSRPHHPTAPPVLITHRPPLPPTPASDPPLPQPPPLPHS